VHAIQLAGTKARVLDRLHDFDNERRKSTVQSRFFTDVFLGAVWVNTSAIGTGLVLLLSASKLSNASMTVDELALFIIYAGWVTDFTSLSGQNLTQMKQASISLDRTEDAVPGTINLVGSSTSAPTLTQSRSG